MTFKEDVMKNVKLLSGLAMVSMLFLGSTYAYACGDGYAQERKSSPLVSASNPTKAPVSSESQSSDSTSTPSRQPLRVLRSLGGY